MSAAAPVDRVFLSVVFWPQGMARHELAALIADASSIDQHTVHLKLGQAPPTILGLFPRETADRAIAALQGKGGDGFATSLDDLGELGPTLKIRDLRIEGGVIVAELWRGQPTRIRPCDIQVVVRAKMSEKLAAPLPSALDASHALRYAVPPGRRHVAGAGTAGPLWVLGGAYGAAIGLAYAYLSGDVLDVLPRPDIRLSHKLDLHTRDGKVYQIDGDKFGFQILGDLRGPSDNGNIDAMCELIVTLNRDVIVDPYFSLWRPPAGHERLRLPMQHANNDDPAFAFYSRWTTLVYRHILARST